MRGITRYVEDLLRSRRPRPFAADADDAAMARTAITLRSARPGSGAPTEEFVTSLHKRLAAELDAAAPEAGPDPAAARPRRRSFVRAASVAAGAAAAGAGIDHLLGPGSAPAPAPAAAVIRPEHGSWQGVTGRSARLCWARWSGSWSGPRDGCGLCPGCARTRAAA
jgi:cytochrome b6-f complex iron-sulfur subunit